jgi:hypothetical protein
MGAIKGVGSGAVATIVENRKDATNLPLTAKRNVEGCNKKESKI